MRRRKRTSLRKLQNRWANNKSLYSDTDAYKPHGPEIRDCAAYFFPDKLILPVGAEGKKIAGFSAHRIVEDHIFFCIDRVVVEIHVCIVYTPDFPFVGGTVKRPLLPAHTGIDTEFPFFIFCVLVYIKTPIDTWSKAGHTEFLAGDHGDKKEIRVGIRDGDRSPVRSYERAFPRGCVRQAFPSSGLRCEAYS